MQGLESPLEFLNWLKRLRAVRAARVWGGPRGPEEGWKGWRNGRCHSVFPICLLIVHRQRAALSQGTVSLTLPLASALDPSSKGRPLWPTRPVSTSKCPYPTMPWWSTARAASHAGIVWFSLKTGIMQTSETSLLFPLNCSVWLSVSLSL